MWVRFNWSVQDRRVYERIPVSVTVIETCGEATYYHTSTNLSVGGLYIERTLAHKQGTYVDLEFALPFSNERIEVRGEVIGDPHAGGMRIRFVDVSPELKLRIADAIARKLAK
jgi:hypothetical protein